MDTPTKQQTQTKPNLPNLPDTFKSLLDDPIFFQGIIIHGYGRGSKQLGIPTANIDPIPFKSVLDKIDNGVYFGFARVCDNIEPEHSEIYPMSMSIGFNPQFNNSKKSIEPYIIHEFPNDFYGAHLKILCLGYLRAEQSFSSMDALKEAISNDVKQSLAVLQLEDYQKMKKSDLLDLTVPMKS